MEMEISKNNSRLRGSLGWKKMVLLAGIVVVGLVEISIYWSHHLYEHSQNVEENERKIRTLEKAGRFNPFNHDVYHGLGKAYFDQAMASFELEEARRSNLKKSIQALERAVRINPASYFSHFQLGQSLLYMSYIQSSEEITPFEEYKKAALLAGHYSQIFYETGKVFLTHWDELSEEDRNFTVEILKRVLDRGRLVGSERMDRVRELLYIWELNVGDYEVIERILPEEAKTYRMYADFIGEMGLSVEERQEIMVKAEAMDFERAEKEFEDGENDFMYFRLKNAYSHFNSCLGMLNKIRFYQSLRGGQFINPGEYESLRKSCFLYLAKCGIEEGKELRDVQRYLREYIEREKSVAALREVESYLLGKGWLEEELKSSMDDLERLALQAVLYYNQNRYRDIMGLGRELKGSFVVVPDKNRAEYVEVLRLIGDSFHKVDYIYEAVDFYEKALEVDPGNLKVLLRMKEVYGRLNEDENVRRYDEMIRGVLNLGEVEAVRDMGSVVLQRGGNFRRNFTFDGRQVRMRMDFKQDWGERVPLVAVYFNNRVVWEGYLRERDGGERRSDAGKGQSVGQGGNVSLTFDTRVGVNELHIVPLNRKVTLQSLSFSLF